MTPQQAIQAKLGTVGIPAKEIRVYGSQIMITAWSEGAARKWARLLAQFATVKAMKESVEYTKVNAGGCLNPSTYRVWLVWAVLA